MSKELLSNEQIKLKNYFKGNPFFSTYLDDNKESLLFIYEMMNKSNWTCGLSYDEIINIINNKKEFKLLKTFKNFLDSFSSEISKYDACIIMINGSKKITLDEGMKIINTHFKKLDYVYQIFFDEEGILDNYEVNFLLLK